MDQPWSQMTCEPCLYYNRFYLDFNSFISLEITGTIFMIDQPTNEIWKLFWYIETGVGLRIASGLLQLSNLSIMSEFFLERNRILDISFLTRNNYNLINIINNNFWKFMPITFILQRRWSSFIFIHHPQDWGDWLALC